jgi:hypothetical protein
VARSLEQYPSEGPVGCMRPLYSERGLLLIALWVAGIACQVLLTFTLGVLTKWFLTISLLQVRVRFI